MRTRRPNLHGKTARLAKNPAELSGSAGSIDHKFGLLDGAPPDLFLKLEAGRTRAKKRISLPHVSILDRKKP